jgi:hypothetical protein
MTHNCTQLVEAIDYAPIRTPQALHTLMLPLITGKRLVELGTRNGDGIVCFAQVASSAVAVEMSPAYCAVLNRRAGALRTQGQPSFSVECANYTQLALNADIFTWWFGLSSLDMMAIGHLRSQQAAGLVSPSVTLLLPFEAPDRRDVSGLVGMGRHLVKWGKQMGLELQAETVIYDETAQCKQTSSQSMVAHHEWDEVLYGKRAVAGSSRSAAEEDRLATVVRKYHCRRAKGTFGVARAVLSSSHPPAGRARAR